MKCLLFIGLLALSSIANAQGQGGCAARCAQQFVEYNGCCYRFSSGVTYTPTGLPVRYEGLPFAQANLNCRQMHPDAHLVVINDAAEHEFIFNMVPSVEPIEMWIGLSYNATTLTWQWVNGDPVTYTAWEPYYGEPLVLRGGGALMFLSEVFTQATTRKYGYGLEVSDFWNTEMVDEPFPFMCEYPLQMVQRNTTTETNTTRNTNSTAQTPTGGPPTMAPQILFQREARPMRLSDFLGFGGLHERKFNEERRGGARPAYNGPQAYRHSGGYGGYAESRNQQYGYGYPVMP